MPKPSNKKSLAIDSATHKLISIAAATEEREMFSLIAEAWECREKHKRGELVPFTGKNTRTTVATGGASKVTSESSEGDADHIRLQRIHDSGHDIAITAIRHNLIAFEVLVSNVSQAPVGTPGPVDHDREIKALREKTDAAMRDTRRSGAHGKGDRERVGGHPQRSRRRAGE